MTMVDNRFAPWAGDSEQEQTLRMAQEFLGRFRYKPNWHFEMTRQPQMGTPCVRIKVLVEDSRAVDMYGPSNAWECPRCNSINGAPRIPIEGMYPIPMLSRMQAPEKLFFDFLHQCVWSVERHESDEWFRVDGELRHDPHAGDWMVGK